MVPSGAVKNWLVRPALRSRDAPGWLIRLFEVLGSPRGH
jgi:hypothetical protein